MIKPRLLSGCELVAKGALKNSTTLPEVGPKDVTPSGSWLEQKQIQSALEARKNLIEVERIEKCGVLSQAEWREELMLAEVIQQSGGHWKFLGHHKDKLLYLYPEEALFLMEVNCLLLKYNNVTVSLQQAYSLLLRDKISLIQYKVYASLSRLGYKVFRYVQPEFVNNRKSELQGKQDFQNDLQLTCNCEAISVDTNQNIKDIKQNDSNSKSQDLVQPTGNNDKNSDVIPIETDIIMLENEANLEEKVEEKPSECNNSSAETNLSSTNGEHSDEVMVSSSQDTSDINITQSTLTESRDDNENKPEETNFNNYIKSDIDIQVNKEITGNTFYQKLQYQKSRLMKKRQIRLSEKNTLNYFANIPDFFQSDSVIIEIPGGNIPNNIMPSKASYELNLNNIRTKILNLSPIHTDNSSTSNENTEVRRIESSNSYRSLHNQTQFYSSQFNFPQQQPLFNDFSYFRPRFNCGFIPFHVLLQRPFFRNSYYPPRQNFYHRTPHIFTRPSQSNTFETNNTNRIINSRKRMNERKHEAKNDEQISRLNNIKKIALRLKIKQFVAGENVTNLIDFLKNVIQTYNMRYKTRVTLTDDLEIVENENIVETIHLEDDEVRSKKPKLQDCSKFDDNLFKIKQLAKRFKDLVVRHEASTRHKRALAHLIKIFNESFNSDIYMNANYEIIDRNHITLDSSSDSDCVVNETESENNKKITGKKLRNPFNVLKQISEKNKLAERSLLNDFHEGTLADDTAVQVPNNKYSDILKKAFSKYWLPSEDDFGRAEVTSKRLSLFRIIETNKEELLFDFIKNQTCKFKSWSDIKIAFMENMETASLLFQNENMIKNSTELDSIIKPEDCNDMPSVLKKLNIIPNNMKPSNATALNIDFDVYNKDVKNFKKSNRPKPHFRVICLNESSSFPSGEDIVTLHSNHDDQVPIVFAVVGCSSVSYLQITPTNLPMYPSEGELN